MSNHFSLAAHLSKSFWIAIGGIDGPEICKAKISMDAPVDSAGSNLLKQLETKYILEVMHVSLMHCMYTGYESGVGSIFYMWRKSSRPFWFQALENYSRMFLTIPVIQKTLFQEIKGTPRIWGFSAFSILYQSFLIGLNVRPAKVTLIYTTGMLTMLFIKWWTSRVVCGLSRLEKQSFQLTSLNTSETVKSRQVPLNQPKLLRELPEQTKIICSSSGSSFEGFVEGAVEVHKQLASLVNALSFFGKFTCSEVILVRIPGAYHCESHFAFTIENWSEQMRYVSDSNGLPKVFKYLSDTISCDLKVCYPSSPRRTVVELDNYKKPAAVRKQPVAGYRTAVLKLACDLSRDKLTREEQYGHFET